MMNNGHNINNNMNHKNIPLVNNNNNSNNAYMTQRGQTQSWFGADRQNDKYNISENYPFALEPFGHDGSYMDDSYRYQSNAKYQSNFNDSIYSEFSENYFPSHFNDQLSFRHNQQLQQHQHSELLDGSLPLNTENLSTFVAKYQTQKGLTSSIAPATTPNTISPTSQSSQSSFSYLDLPF